MLVPATKSDHANASALVALGFPAVAPVMHEILEWMQDLNWPVACVLRPFLVGIGEPLTPYVRVVLDGDDDAWKYSLLVSVVRESTDLARALTPDLEHLAKLPNFGEAREEVDQVAREILAALDGGPIAAFPGQQEAP